MEDWMNCDEDILTASCSELTDAEIIELAHDEARNSDDVDNPDQHDVSIQKPPAIEVRKALQCLRDFSLCMQTDVSLLKSIAALESEVSYVMVAHARQTKITEFFS